MLELLHIENIAVVESAELVFSKGLSVLTGETGAGKSIVIDALSAVAGGRASKELLRAGADSASVTALFSGDGLAELLVNTGIEPDEEGRLFLQRKIGSDGKSSCRAGGIPVPLAQLREIGERLVDIHGQNDGRKLLDEAKHLEYLDAFGTDPALLKAYAEAYKNLRDVEAEIKSLSLSEDEKARRTGELTRQIKEIERAALKEGEYAALTERLSLLENSEKLVGSVDIAFNALDGEEDVPGVVALIQAAGSAIAGVARSSGALSDFRARLRELEISAKDLLEELSDFRARFDFSPEELDKLYERIELIRRLMKKYGDSEAEIIDRAENSKSELSDIEYSEDRIQKLEKKRTALQKEAMAAADVLSSARKKAAEKLKENVTRELNGLSMAGVRFIAEFSEIPDGGINIHGRDEVRFLMSANAGEQPGRITRIASGGELSRIMLALKNVLTENDGTGTVVFDEIDAGVSGIAAQRVGEKLSDLARGRQVLCVTHLPQIAAMADFHFEIKKAVRGGRTYTEVSALDTGGRKNEIARLTGGENITDAALTAAAEQLEAAGKYKESKVGKILKEPRATGIPLGAQAVATTDISAK